MKGLKFLIYIILVTFPNRVFSQNFSFDFPEASLDSFYNAIFTRDYGWNGGDGAYSLLLPDGRILWSFGDSFYGQVDPERNRDGNKNVMVRNAFLVQENKQSDKLTSLNPGYLEHTKSLLKVKEADESLIWYWPLDATVCKDELQMVLMRMKKTGEGMWGFAGTAVDVALFSLPEIKLKNIICNKVSGDLPYGSAIWEDDNGYTYLYGCTRNGLTTLLHVARVPDRNLTNVWQFWNGNKWQSEPSDFPIHREVSSMFSIWKENDKYFLLTKESNLGRKIFLFESDGPLGPFINRKLIYEVPEEHGAGNMFSYNAVVHPELSTPGELVISYSINTHNFWDNFNKPGSADKYRPVFIRVKRD